MTEDEANIRLTKVSDLIHQRIAEYNKIRDSFLEEIFDLEKEAHAIKDSYNISKQRTQND